MVPVHTGSISLIPGRQADRQAGRQLVGQLTSQGGASPEGLRMQERLLGNRR